MKKCFSLVIFIIVLFASLTGLSGCSKNEQSEYVSRAEWIEMLGTQFGMDEYVSKNAYFADVDEKNVYYKYVQSCADWGVISNVDSKDFKPNSTARVEFAIETALNAANYDSSQMSAMDYAREQGMITDNGYMSARGKLTRENAEKILAWTTSLYLSIPVETYENIVIKDSVVNLVDEITEIKTISEDAFVFSGGAGENLTVGDIVILPGTERDPAGVAKKIVDISINQDGTYSVVTEQPAIEEVCEDFELATVAVPKVEDVILEEGVKIRDNVQRTIGSGVKPSALYLMTRTSNSNVVQLADTQGLNLSFDINFTKGTVGVKRSWPGLFGLGESVSFGGESAYTVRSGLDSDAGQWFEKNAIIPDKNLFGESPYDNTEEIEAYKKGEISLDELKKELDLTKDQHEKEVASMTNKFEGGYEIKGTLDIKNLYVQPELKLKKVLGIPTGIQYFSVTVNYEAEAGLSISGELSEELTVCTCPVAIGATGVTVDVQIVLFAKLNGEIGVKAIVTNNTKIEYDDGLTKKTANKTASLSAEASAELEAGPGVKATVRFFGISIVDAKVNCAIKFKASVGAGRSTEYSETEEEITITRQTTFEYGVEGFVPIITAKVGTAGTLANKVGLSFSWTIIGEEKAYNFEILPPKEIVIWKEVQTLAKLKQEEKTDDFNDYLMISTYYLSLDQDESKLIEIVNLPSGYDISELQWTSSDADVVSVSDGTVLACAPGSATITVTTADGVYAAQCAIDVEDDAIIFTPLEGIEL